MNIQIIDPTSDSRWDEFIANQEYSTIFHTAAWARVIKEAYGYSPRYYVLEDEKSEITAAIPFYLVKSILTGKRLVCLPFSDYCYPLGKENHDISLLLNSAKKEVDTEAVSYMETRGWSNGAAPADPDLKKHDHYILHLINLEPNIDVVEQRLQERVKKSIRQGRKRGMTVRITSSEDDLNQFYRLHIATRKKLGVLTQPKSFFKAVYRHIISQRLGFMAIGELEGKAIAGRIFLIYRDVIYAKFQASDENYLNKRPNHIILWEVLKYACDNGYKNCDLGRCSSNGESLRAFKLGWGAKEIDLPYFYYPDTRGFIAVNEKSTKYKILQSLLHKMPKFAFKAIGSMLYKHVA